MKNEYENVLLKFEPPVARIVLNRPEVRNAFNEKLISELYDVFWELKENEGVRLIVVTGEGKSFCAGADLNWMRSVMNYDFEQNYAETLKLAKLMNLIYRHPKPVIARVNGAAIGGGVGLASACDIVIASDKAVFGLSEVKLGLVPAAISPYVIARIGEARARELFITGERISAAKAYDINLVNQIAPLEKLDEEVEIKIETILKNGPNAVKAAKELIYQAVSSNLDDLEKYTAKLIAELRLSEEAQEGMSAFLEKRKPKWAIDK